MPRLYAHYAVDDGCRFHRLLQPARFVPQDLPGVIIHAATNPPCRSDRYDVYAIHGLPVSSTWEGVASFKHWAGESGRRGKWVWSLDDDFLTVPDWNPAKPPEPAMAHYYLARDAADYILCSTPALAATFADLSDKVLTAPNLIDLTLYPTPEPAPLADGERLRILWHGGPTHRHDVDVVVPAVQHVLTKYAGRVEAIWFGQGVPPDLAASHLHKGLTWQQGVELGLYWSVLKAIRPHVVLAPLAEVPFNLSKCVTGDTLVPTDGGIKTMQSLVNTMAKTVRLEKRSQLVRTWYKYDSRKTLRITTESGFVIEGTPHHRLRRPDGSWVALEELAVGDKLEIIPFEITQKEYQTIFHSLFLATSNSDDPLPGVEEMMMPRVVINENWGRFFGYLMGDGHVASRTVGISCNTDYPDVIADVHRLFLGIGMRAYDVSKGDARRREGLPPPKGVDVRANSTHLRKVLEKLGVVNNKGKVFSVPQVILDSPKSVIREFVRGLFESDACVGKENPSLVFTTKSDVFARQVQFLLLGFGIKSKVVATWNKQYERNYWNVRLGRQACEKYCAEIGFVSQKKQERLNELCRRDHSNAYKEWEWSDSVALIQPGVADVYDVEVAHDHYYLANGFVSHNSNIRILDGWALSAAVLATPWGEYECVRDMEDGLVCRDTVEWAVKLERLIEDAELRVKLAKAGRQRVEREWSWQSAEARRPWKDAVSKIMGL